MSTPMFPVNSSNLDYVGWKDNVLFITFKKGAKFKYLDVPESVFQELRDSTSIGKYFITNIKDVYLAEEM